MARTSQKARSAINCQFVPMDYAASHTDTIVVEKIKVVPIKHRG